jgi:hypothetical protein
LNNDRYSATLPIDFHYRYHLGISASTGTGAVKQQISSWEFTSTDAAQRNNFGGFHEGYSFIEDFVLLGSAKLASDGRSLQLGRTRSAGAAFYNAPFYAQIGFKTTFVWTPTQCDSNQSNG